MLWGPGSLRLRTAPFRPVFLVTADDAWKFRQPGLPPDRPQFVGRLPQPGIIERAGIDIDFVGPRIVRVDLRAAGRAEISPPVLGACEGVDLSSDRHRFRREHSIEAEGHAVQLPAGQAMAHANAIGLTPRLDADLATGAAAFMHAI